MCCRRPGRLHKGVETLVDMLVVLVGSYSLIVSHRFTRGRGETVTESVELRSKKNLLAISGANLYLVSTHTRHVEVMIIMHNAL